MTENTEPRRLTREELAAAYGHNTATLQRLWAAREENGHPPGRRVGRSLTWDAAEFEAWDRKRQSTITGAEFARLLGHKDHGWVSRAATVPPPGFPEPVAWTNAAERRGPQWDRAAAQAYADTRPPTETLRGAGAGRRTGTRQGTAYANDPRLTAARKIIAKHPDESIAQHTQRLNEKLPGTSATVWRKIILTARDKDQT
ncbi:hypothetical protein OG321_42230 [Streptomyces sp. NBC_00424]|uniref:hypothetical protein n=1 Tax=Streptomyces sp. NBC_00424 TaxID=2903648 RepID=UPI00225056AB|nr:hypothetical protein [Streptomyces sp. NBC_00424]MCX5079016.1 hypothetical protein [Streptomyces sp. NBC_00424]